MKHPLTCSLVEVECCAVLSHVCIRVKALHHVILCEINSAVSLSSCSPSICPSKPSSHFHIHPHLPLNN